jgi:hypothetical protein
VTGSCNGLSPMTLRRAADPGAGRQTGVACRTVRVVDPLPRRGSAGCVARREAATRPSLSARKGLLTVWEVGVRDVWRSFDRGFGSGSLFHHAGRTRVPRGVAISANTRSPHQQDVLSAHVAVLADAVRLRDLSGWEGLRDREPDGRTRTARRCRRTGWTARPSSRLPIVSPCRCVPPKPVIVRTCSGPHASSDRQPRRDAGWAGRRDVVARRTTHRNPPSGDRAAPRTDRCAGSGGDGEVVDHAGHAGG